MASRFGDTTVVKEQGLVDVGYRWQDTKEEMFVSLSVHDVFNQRQRLVTPFIDSGTDVYHYKGRELSLGAELVF